MLIVELLEKGDLRQALGRIKPELVHNNTLLAESIVFILALVSCTQPIFLRRFWPTVVRQLWGWFTSLGKDLFIETLQPGTFSSLAITSARFAKLDLVILYKAYTTTIVVYSIDL